LKFFADRPPSERIIRLPKKKIIVKAIVFYYMEFVAAGSISISVIFEVLSIRLNEERPENGFAPL